MATKLFTKAADLAADVYYRALANIYSRFPVAHCILTPCTSHISLELYRVSWQLAVEAKALKQKTVGSIEDSDDVAYKLYVAEAEMDDLIEEVEQRRQKRDEEVQKMMREKDAETKIKLEKKDEKAKMMLEQKDVEAKKMLEQVHEDAENKLKEKDGEIKALKDKLVIMRDQVLHVLLKHELHDTFDQNLLWENL